MKYRDFVSSLFWMGFGILFCVYAWQYGLIGGPGIPGPGCLPFIVGVGLISLSFEPIGQLAVNTMMIAGNLPLRCLSPK